MDQKFNLAIVGSTGNVGREIISILDERDFPINNLYLLASSRSKGQIINYKDKEIAVEDLAEFDFSKVQIGLFSPGGSVSAEYAPKAAKAGCLVIDNTSFFRMKKDVPLIVPEVNAHALKDFFERDSRSNIISNPNCSTIQMVVALKPLHDEAIINRIIVSTYQSVSGSGKAAMDELFEQTKSIYANQTIEKNKFTKQIAFNVIPHIDSFLENGNTKEEQKMINETKKILDEGIKVSATCVRVPVFVSHSESVNIEFDSPLSEKRAKELLMNFQNVSVVDHRNDEGYV
ncbi:aspartate-semialdehyde dehydrogenase, partial [Alphaproteobacteria bacterium]|nr:aspartate-semialdehyde dehydrogenase [Alphaproteobacteria bacterium]